MRRFVAVSTATLALAAVAGCGGASSAGLPADNPNAARIKPDLAKFLQLPPATPSACPSTANGTTIGRSSPWVGTVDISVFMKPTASAAAIATLGKVVRATPLVGHAYYESQTEAYQEFQRLYTCWTSVPQSQTPPSYRLVLVHTATIGSRNRLVARLASRSDVDSVSCDPSVPCTDIIESGRPTASSTPTPTTS